MKSKEVVDEEINTITMKPNSLYWNKKEAQEKTQVSAKLPLTAGSVVQKYEHFI